MRRLLATAGYTLLLLLSFICSCTSPENRTTPLHNSSSVSNATPDVAESRTDTVEIKEMKFQPAVLTVSPGTTVVFINHDMVTHDVTEEATKAWSSKLLPPGKSWSMTVEKSANYFCSIHVVMKGRLVVK